MYDCEGEELPHDTAGNQEFDPEDNEDEEQADAVARNNLAPTTNGLVTNAFFPYAFLSVLCAKS